MLFVILLVGCDAAWSQPGAAPVQRPVVQARREIASAPAAPRVPEVAPSPAPAAPVEVLVEEMKPVELPLAGEDASYRGHVFRVVGGAGEAPSATEAIRYRVLVERGLEEHAATFTAEVERVLGDANGWARAGLPLVRVNEGEDLSVILGRPKTIDNLCAPMRTGGTLSCALQRQANINLIRFLEGAATWGEDLEGYRGYLINHEVGHVLGMGHAGCPKSGAPAPVMMQQTIRLGRCAPSASPAEGEVKMVALKRKSREARWAKLREVEARWRRRQGAAPKVDPQ